MAKAKRVSKSASDVDLRRWCVEMAIRWPTMNLGPSGYGIASAGGAYRNDVDVDVVARAEKLLAWVSK